ncbi:MAG: hypothetical protein JSR46_08745, partial [Verrucomicrobia bacterium]|nr:hypothetical protein [Verrucomicrobiota bacterium]
MGLLNASVDLAILRDVLPGFITTSNSISDILALTSTCKMLNNNRWEAIAEHPKALSLLLKQFFIVQAQPNNDSFPTTVIKQVVSWLFGKEPSQTEQFLKLFQRTIYQTEFSLITP